MKLEEKENKVMLLEKYGGYGVDQKNEDEIKLNIEYLTISLRGGVTISFF